MVRALAEVRQLNAVNRLLNMKHWIAVAIRQKNRMTSTLVTEVIRPQKALEIFLHYSQARTLNNRAHFEILAE